MHAHGDNIATVGRAALLLLAVVVVPVAQAAPASGSTACGHPAPANPPGSLPVGGSERQAIVVVPAGYRPDVALPLVIAFHGRTNYNARLRSYLELEEAAPRPAIFVYPAARRATGGGFTWAAADGRPDLALLDGILIAIGRSYCIDRSAVFLVGHSLGATFANDLACARASEIAGVGTVAGGITQRRCVGRVPALLLHNPRDELVPLAEGDRARDALLGSPLAAARPVAEALDDFACLRAGSGRATLSWCLYQQNMTSRGRYYPHQWPDGASRLIMSFFARVAASGTAPIVSARAAGLPR